MLQSRNLPIVIPASAYLFLLFDCFKAISRPLLRGHPGVTEINHCIFSLNVTQISPVAHGMAYRALSTPPPPFPFPPKKISPEWQPLKNHEHYLLFHIEISEIFSFFSTLSRFKRARCSGIIYNVMTWFAYISRCFGVTQKPLYVTSTNLVAQVIHTK